MSQKLILVPVKISDACSFIKEHHRHLDPPQGALFAVAIGYLGSVTENDGKIVEQGIGEIRGVATVGRPVARLLDNGWTVEVTRVCVLEGTPNGCSMLYAACWRAARAMGYKKAITYMLDTERGVSLQGAGWTCVGEAGGGKWDRKNRPRVDKNPEQMKLRWEMSSC